MTTIPTLREALDWPADGRFTFVDETGEHDPCYVVMPGGPMIPLNHHATPGVDIARAKFIIDACNAALAAVDQAVEALAGPDAGDGLTLPPPGYIMSQPHLSGWRVVLGYETLADAQAAHSFLAGFSAASRPQDAPIDFEPWKHGVGEPPEWDSPLMEVWQAACGWTLGIVGRSLGADKWEGGDGTESIDGDIAAEVGHIMRAAGLRNEDGDPITRDDLASLRASTPQPEPAAGGWPKDMVASQRNDEHGWDKVVLTFETARAACDFHESITPAPPSAASPSPPGLDEGGVEAAADTPGVAPEEVPIPQADLRDVRLTLDPGGAGRSSAIVIRFSDYGAAGRVFKWLMGMVRLARG